MVECAYLTQGRSRQWERIWAEENIEDELWNKVPEEMKENGIKIHVEKQALGRRGDSSLSFLNSEKVKT